MENIDIEFIMSIFYFEIFLLKTSLIKTYFPFRSSLSADRGMSTGTSGAESSDATEDMVGKQKSGKSKKQVITHRAVTNVNHLDIPAQVSSAKYLIDEMSYIINYSHEPLFNQSSNVFYL